jgi:hypothetical protein
MASKHAQGQKQMRASEFAPRKLVIFDIDDTLVHTQTKVHVVKDGHITKELNSHEFTHYKLQPGEHFDFENFRNAKEFFNNSKPIIPMMNQLKHDIATGNKVVMVTARADFDDKELFLDTFRKYGVDMNKVHVYRAGNMTQKVQTEEKKKIIIRNLLNQSHYTKAIMYDDAVPNLDSFVSLKKEYPDTKFYAWHVSLDGVASEYGRTNEGLHTVNNQLSEKINNAITQPDWHAEKIINLPEVGELILRAKNLGYKQSPEFMVDVFTPDNENIGYFRFVIHDWEPEKTWWFPGKKKKNPYVVGGNISVWKQYQKKGIATAVYQCIESLGNDIRPSNSQTAAGQAMWNGFRKKDTVK